MRSAGRIKLGYYPLHSEEARKIRALLVPSAPYAAIDPCVGDGSALLEITRDTGAHLSAIELDADRAAAADLPVTLPESTLRLRDRFTRESAHGTPLS